ncbi:MAG: hypothetical protein ACNI27_14135 [Desulfovibrio sp.]
MANIKDMTYRELERAMPHSDVEASYSIVEVDGDKFLQIDTYGSQKRQDKGTVSQSIRFSRESLKQLAKIIETHFV